MAEWTVNQLKEFLETILAEQRDELVRQIQAGDEALKDHITAQIGLTTQLTRSLNEQTRLRVDGVVDTLDQLNAAGREHFEARINSVASQANQQLDQLRREREIVTAAQTLAISKADIATEKRFEGVNEWRAQSADRERAHREQATAMQDQFARREVLDAQLNEVRKLAQDAKDLASGASSLRSGSVQALNWMVAGTGVLVAVIAVVANVLTG